MAAGVLDRFLAIEAEFRGSTPYLGGGWEAETLRRLAGDTWYASGAPKATQLLGRMRWLLRAAMGVDGVRSAEASGPVATAKCGRNVTGLSLPTLLFGGTPAQGLSCSWKGLARLHVEHLSTLYGAEQQLIFVPNNKWERARPRLLGMGKQPDHLRVDPLKPQVASFRARLYIERRRGLKLHGPLTTGDLAALAAALLAVTPTIFGLGKAVNRGFGRFRLASYKLGRLSESSSLGGRLKGLLESLRDLDRCGDPGGCESIVDRVLGGLSGLAEEVLRRAGAAVNQLPEDAWPSRSPVLRARVVRAKRVNASNVKGVLERIGQASTKNRWKSLLGRPLTSPGLDIHTWPLGLPRSQNFPGTCMGGFRPKDKLKTGYLLASLDSEVVCVAFRGFSGGCTPVGRVRIEEPRRQSMVIAFPAGDGRTVVSILLPSMDMMDFFRGVNGLRLYHSGPCNVRNNYKPCVSLFVDVAWAAGSRGSASSSGYSGCSKPVGVEGLGSADLLNQDDYRKVVNLAFCMFFRAL